MRRRGRVSVNLKGLNVTRKAVRDAVEEGIYDVTDDLIRTSSEATPHWKGILEQSYSREVTVSGDKISAIVDYAVREDTGYNNGFDYAFWIHEGEYELGEKSKEKAAAGGGQGMSGKTYDVGREFLTRVLEGEADTYIQYIQDKVNEATR
jgi:hypothetical protein